MVKISEALPVMDDRAEHRNNLLTDTTVSLAEI